MAISRVTSKWVDGDLVFYQGSTEIARFDYSAHTFDIKYPAIGGTAVTATAAEINKLSGSGAAIASGTQASLIADPADGTTIDAEARAAINSIIDALQAFGVVAAE